MAYSARFDRAFALAHELHRNQLRKGTDVPYIIHLMSVASLVADYGGSEDQVIAGLLHDAVEDQGGTPTAERIRKEFGEVVHRIVMGCTDSVSDDPKVKAPWRERKEKYLAHLVEAPAQMRLVSAADKIHNARAILADVHRGGLAVFTRFKGGLEGTLWYYRSLVTNMRKGWSHEIVDELERVVGEMEREVERRRNDPAVR